MSQILLKQALRHSKRRLSRRWADAFGARIREKMTGLASNWKVHADEISNGVYKVVGTRITGESFEATSSDPAAKMIELGLYCQEINRKYEQPPVNPFYFPYFDTDLHGKVSKNVEYFLMTEVLHGNYVQEYWTGYGSFMKLGKEISKDGLICVRRLGLIREERNDIHWGKSEVSEVGQEWKILEPFQK